MHPRRSGKDFLFFRILCYLCLKNPNTNAAYLFPDIPSARRILWDSVFLDVETGKATRYLAFIPRTICEPNQAILALKFQNGSRIQIINTTDMDKVRGLTSPLIAVSEYCFQKPEVLKIISPVISAFGS